MIKSNTKMVDLINEIHDLQLKTFCRLDDFRKFSIEKLPTGHRGLYWIWTNLSFEELSKLYSSENSKEVPIPTLVKQRKDLKGVCKFEKEGFTIVYNGIGGYIKNTYGIRPTFGLRERILQEINCFAKRTGTLNIVNRSTEEGFEKRWAVSYVDFDNINNQNIYNTIIKSFDEYPQNAKAIELMWRFQYGMPILSRH